MSGGGWDIPDTALQWRLSQVAERLSPNRMTTTPESTDPSADYFAPTLWTVVINAQKGDTTVARNALNRLCEIYRYPIYIYVRRRTPSPHDAEDLTQGYFMDLLRRGYVQQASREQGRFRAFLLADLKYYLSNQRARAASAKRGGGREIISLDAETAETLAGAAPDESPEAAFDRSWAQQVLQRVMARLRADYEKHGRGALFDAIKQFIGWNAGGESYAGVSEKLGKSPGYIKANVHRMREHYREILRLEVSETTPPGESVDDEIRYLASCLR